MLNSTARGQLQSARIQDDNKNKHADKTDKNQSPLRLFKCKHKFIKKYVYLQTPLAAKHRTEGQGGGAAEHT
jgi:hypothetical protein